MEKSGKDNFTINYKCFTKRTIYVNSDIVERLENKIARLTNSKYCVCTNSGTDALTLGLHASWYKKK